MNYVTKRCDNLLLCFAERFDFHCVASDPAKGHTDSKDAKQANGVC